MSRNPFPVLKFIADGAIVIAAIVFTSCFLAVIYLAVNGYREYGIIVACVALPLSLGLNIFGELIGVLLAIERNGRLQLEQNQQPRFTAAYPVEKVDAAEEIEQEQQDRIVIVCPSCGTGFAAGHAVLGKAVRCGKCGLKFTAHDRSF